jgi:hypothetical protein
MNPSAGPMANGLGTPMQATPMQNMTSQAPLPSQGPSAIPPTATPVQRPLATPKPQKTPKSAPSSALPAPPLDDVHAAFVEFRAKEEDKVCCSTRRLASRREADGNRSASQSSVYIATRSGPRILVDNASTFKNVLLT